MTRKPIGGSVTAWVRKHRILASTILLLALVTLPYGSLSTINFGDASDGSIVVVPVGTKVNVNIDDDLWGGDCYVAQQGVGGVACNGDTVCRAVSPGFTQLYLQCHEYQGASTWAATVVVL
jgi:hypothetical protein